jgi:hypothetical protein
VKELHFAAHFHRQLRTRCPKDDVSETDYEDEVDDEINMTDYDSDDEADIDGTDDDEVDEASNYDQDVDDEINDGGTDDREFDETGNHDNETDVENVEITYDNETSSNFAPPSQSVHDGFLEALESRLIPLFNCFPDDSLEKFRFVIPLASALALILI